ncbi:hypothetical protein [Candidatus Palauibacter sp.]|uniref:hypothetical protein n=1 Tax=Candidatus Palauibacter sp. TaxID=3101350 RepID=UPI003B0282B4
MTELRIADNPGLSGRLPLSLANLSLRTLHYDMTDLCYPAETSFRDWLNTIASHEGTGAECEPPMDRKVLEVLYGATGGPQWTNSENWLTDAPLGEWYGVDVDGEGRVQVLGLFGNNLSGPIPVELGSLTGLRELYLRDNALTGPIPAELGNLTSLRRLLPVRERPVRSDSGRTGGPHQPAETLPVREQPVRSDSGRTGAPRQSGKTPPGR